MSGEKKLEPGDVITGQLVDDDDVRGLLGEGIHTGLRKGTDAPSSADLWNAISRSNDGAWPDAIRYCLWGLDRMGYKIVKVEGL